MNHLSIFQNNKILSISEYTKYTKTMILKLLMLTLFISVTLYAKINHTFYSSETWYHFEPGEDYSVSGSYFYSPTDKETKFFPYVSDFINSKEKVNATETETTTEKKIKNSLGLRLTWDRIGAHYADIIPSRQIRDVKKISTKSIEKISLWVWSGNYQHQLSAVFQQESGYQYVLPLTKLNFLGWHKISAEIPDEIKIDSGYSYFTDREFYFDRLRIQTHPRERVKDIYIFLDSFEILRKLEDSTYNGKNLVPIIQKELDVEIQENQKESKGNKAEPQGNKAEPKENPKPKGNKAPTN